MAATIIRAIILMLLFTGIITLTGCKNTSSDKPLRIALSSGSPNYVNWVHRGDSTIEIIDLKDMNPDSAIKLLSSCDGIIFTGGEDVVPSYYGKGFDSARCESNPARDVLEMALIKEAMGLKMPVFGVCRGQQILNVALGGTLIVDIPTDKPGNVLHRCEDYTRCFHKITAIKGSQLFLTSQADTGTVTTNHHQAIEKPAPEIRITAWSADSTAEAMEWADPEGKSFLMTVQWHPERMDTISPFSMPLIKKFLLAAQAYRKNK